ncbi:MAG: multidrug efflux SMR transporter [Arthrobacter sp.]
MSWIFLAAAILTEVGAACALRMASQGPRKWYFVVIVGYVTSFVMLSLTLQSGLGIGIAYGIWAATGTALTALAGRFLFKEPFTWIMAVGIALIVGGVLLIELGSAAA